MDEYRSKFVPVAFPGLDPEKLAERLEQRIEQLEQRVAELEKHSQVPMDVTGLVYDALKKKDGVIGWRCAEDPNPWRTHDGDRMPKCYAPAQMVEWRIERGSLGEAGPGYEIFVRRADSIPWWECPQHRPVIREGLPVVSAEGLHPAARYVATCDDGEVCQFTHRPDEVNNTCWLPSLKGINDTMPLGHEAAPDTHRIPGDWRESLAIVDGAQQ